MKRSKLRTFGAAVAVLGLLGAATTFLTSFKFNPDPKSDSSFIARAQQKSASGITVTISVLGARESQKSFGEDLARHNIQPVWLSIENKTDAQLGFLPIELDPDYYSPFEVSYRFHGLLAFAANRARDDYFLRRQIAGILPPHSTTTGFVYGVLDSGVKYARVVIVGKNRYDEFDFALPVPGPAFVGSHINPRTIYPGKNIEELQLDTLRAKLAEQPCCTTDKSGTSDGDPLNIVIVESQQDPIVPFIANGWHLARTLDVVSAMQTARAFFFRDEFLTSPVSPLYVFGRSEDFVLQKARSTINERVHARFWLTPYTFERRRVWIGQVSRDIGVRLTDQTWNLTTHKIAPDVDFDRNYLLQGLLRSGFVERYGFVTGVVAAPPHAPRKNLTGDPYYTDGLRAVVFLSSQPRALRDIDRLPWEDPIPPLTNKP